MSVHRLAELPEAHRCLKILLPCPRAVRWTGQPYPAKQMWARALNALVLGFLRLDLDWQDADLFADSPASRWGQDGDPGRSVMPSWDKISHISFSTPDKATCVAWFERALQFSAFEDVEGEGWSGVMMMHAPSATVIEFQQHDRNEGETFDPRRTGLDHIGFKVRSREDLEDWQRLFQSLDVDYTPIVDREYGSVLTFRDPDKRQFEMFYREGHP